MSKAYLIPICKVVIGQLTFTSVNDIHIHSHFDEFTDTATIILPRNYRLKGKEIQDYINEGVGVSISLGYEHTGLIEEYKGYVSEITPGTPMVIKCEDEMWKVKEMKPITKTWKEQSLKGFLSEILPEYQIQVADIQIGKFVANNASIMQILEELKSKYRLRSFFLGSTFYCDFANHTQNTKHKITFQKNIRSKRVSFVNEKSKKIQIKAIANRPNGTKEIVYVGDKGGDSQTLNFGNISKTDLKKYAEAELGTKKLTGLRGTITSYGVHRIKHSDVVDIKDKTYPEYNGIYLVDSVDTHLGQDGYYRVNKLGLKL